MFVVDTDPGLDDAHAIAMITKHVSPTSLAFTTVAGNVDLESTTRNALWLLDEFGVESPVYAGAAGPLVGAAVDASPIHGADGLGGLPRSAPAARDPLPAPSAAQRIVELARQDADGLRIIALGPLTNIAIAIALEPALPGLVQDVTIMGGSPAQHGNASLNAEYNIFADAVAAESVFSRMHNITLVTWDLSLSTRFTGAEMAAFFSSDSRQANTLRRLHEHRIANDPAYAASADFGRADPLAVAAALEPGSIASSRSRRVHVVYDSGIAHGVTVVDERDACTDRPLVRIIDSFHREPLLAALTI